MKINRHEALKKTIENNEVQTQEQLQFLMEKEGYVVTQATISRDIKELKLIKLPLSATKSIYAFSSTNNPNMPDMAAVLRSSVKTINTASNLVVIKCYPGMANSACALIDNTSSLPIVGTLAGDDTIFLATKSESIALEIKRTLKDLI